MTDAQVRTLLALLAVYARTGRATVHAVARERGVGLSTTHAALRKLRHAGFVAWESGRAGTLRPLVATVR